MTKEERYAFILDKLIKQESVLVADLADLLEVSSVTIRKDLTELEKAGKLYRSHGGAILRDPFASNRSVNEKQKLYPEAKEAIGRRAAQFISHDDSIVIASGTTMHAFARQIVPKHQLTVVTASIQVAEYLATHDNVDIIQLGGILRHSSLSVVGDFCLPILNACSFTKLFMGVDGIDLDYGITTTDVREAELNRKMMEVSRKTIVLADSSKFGKRGFAKIANMDEVDVIVTDSNVKPKIVEEIERLGIELVIVESSAVSGTSAGL